MGPSLYGAALTTVGSGLPLLWCDVLLFRQMGELICVCCALSFFIALTLHLPLLHLLMRAASSRLHRQSGSEMWQRGILRPDARCLQRTGGSGAAQP